MAIREGRWDCVACGRVANLGRDLRCAGCGRARGKVKFYLPKDEPAVREAELAALAQAGPDWVCGYCEASNRSTSQACTGCGAARAEGASRVRGGGDADEGLRSVGAAGEAPGSTARSREQEAAWAEARRKQDDRWREGAQRRARGLLGLALTLVLACGGMGGYGAFKYRVGGMRGEGGPAIRLGAPSGGPAVELVSKVATRTIDIEENRLVRDENWCTSMPRDARELGRQSRKSGSRRVCALPSHDGGPVLSAAAPPITAWLRVQEDMGNGFFTDSDSGSSGGSSGDGGGSSGSDNCSYVDEYDDWCTWEAFRWVVVRVPTATDQEAVPPWPQLAMLPGERTGAKREVYEGTFRTTDGERLVVAADQSRWLSWHAGLRYQATWSFFGGMKSVGDPVGSGPVSSR